MKPIQTWLLLVLILVLTGPMRALPPVTQQNTSCAGGNQCCICESTPHEGYYGYICTPLSGYGGDSALGQRECTAYQLPNNVAGPVGCSTSGETCWGWYWASGNGHEPLTTEQKADVILAFMLKWTDVPTEELAEFAAAVEGLSGDARYEACRLEWNRRFAHWQLQPGQIPYRPEPETDSLQAGPEASDVIRPTGGTDDTGEATGNSAKFGPRQ